MTRPVIPVSPGPDRPVTTTAEMPSWRGRVKLRRDVFAGRGLDKRQQRGLRRRCARLMAQTMNAADELGEALRRAR